MKSKFLIIMIGPYQMVFINLIGSLLVLGGAICYRFIFPKKRINLLILLVVISILPIISVFRPGVYESGDFNLHIYRAMTFYQNLTEGNLIPSWAGELNGTYGYPLFIFIYPLPYYISSLFHLLNFSFVDSLKLFLCFSYIFSGLAMYFWIKDLFGKISGFAAAIFYLFVPYHLIDIHFRVDIGETLSFVFLPLTLLFARKIIRAGNFKWLFSESLAIAGLILSHQAVSISFIPFIVAYALFEYFSEQKNTIRKIINFFTAFALGLLLSAFYWIPALIDRKSVV